ncbi:MAG: DUF721 domain-containing protein [bacterium]
MLRQEASVTLRRRLGEANAMSQWLDVVGTELATRTRPVQVAGRRLFVVCHGAALRQELAFLKRKILARFNEYAGAGRVRDIVFLESDANLSSLLLEARQEEARLVARESTGPITDPARVDPGDPGEDASREDMEDAEDEPKDPVTYPVFDGEAYREEMRRIARGG